MKNRLSVFLFSLITLFSLNASQQPKTTYKDILHDFTYTAGVINTKTLYATFPDLKDTLCIYPSYIATLFYKAYEAGYNGNITFSNELIEQLNHIKPDTAKEEKTTLTATIMGSWLAQIPMPTLTQHNDKNLEKACSPEQLAAYADFFLAGAALMGAIAKAEGESLEQLSIKLNQQLDLSGLPQLKIEDEHYFGLDDYKKILHTFKLLDKKVTIHEIKKRSNEFFSLQILLSKQLEEVYAEGYYGKIDLSPDLQKTLETLEHSTRNANNSRCVNCHKKHTSPCKQCFETNAERIPLSLFAQFYTNHKGVLQHVPLFIDATIISDIMLNGLEYSKAYFAFAGAVAKTCGCDSNTLKLTKPIESAKKAVEDFFDKQFAQA